MHKIRNIILHIPSIHIINKQQPGQLNNLRKQGRQSNTHVLVILQTHLRLKEDKKWQQMKRLKKDACSRCIEIRSMDFVIGWHSAKHKITTTFQHHSNKLTMTSLVFLPIPSLNMSTASMHNIFRLCQARRN